MRQSSQAIPDTEPAWKPFGTASLPSAPTRLAVSKASIGDVTRPDADSVWRMRLRRIGRAGRRPGRATTGARHRRRTGRAPRAVTADRGYGEVGVEADLHDLGVRRVAIPRKAKTPAARREVEHRRSFRRLVKWRTGSEGRISTLKRGYGWDRSQLDGIHGARIWCGHGVFAHNLVKISALTT